MNRQTLLMALAAVVVAGNALAQTAPPTTQAPPPAAPAAQTPPPQPVPFPADSKIAFVNVQAVLSQSALGKAGATQIEALSKKLQSEITAIETKLKDAQSKQASQSQLLSESAAAQLAKDIDRLTRELNFKREEAQSEYQAMQEDLLQDFQRKVVPLMEALAKEKGLYALFDVGSAGAVYVFPGVDLSPELVKRVDAQFPAKK